MIPVFSMGRSPGIGGKRQAKATFPLPTSAKKSIINQNTREVNAMAGPKDNIQFLKGIGPATAAKIVEKFGDETLYVIENDPRRLATIKGISEEKARKLLRMDAVK